MLQVAIEVASLASEKQKSVGGTQGRNGGVDLWLWCRLGAGDIFSVTHCESIMILCFDMMI